MAERMPLRGRTLVVFDFQGGRVVGTQRSITRLANEHHARGDARVRERLLKTNHFGLQFGGRDGAPQEVAT